MKTERIMTNREIEILEILKSIDTINSDVGTLLSFLSNKSEMKKHGITDLDKDLVEDISKNMKLLVDFFDMRHIPWFSYDDGVFPVYATVYGLHTDDITVNWDSNYSVDEHIETLHDAMILNPKSIA